MDELLSTKGKTINKINKLSEQKLTALQGILWEQRCMEVKHEFHWFFYHK